MVMASAGIPAVRIFRLTLTTGLMSAKFFWIWVWASVAISDNISRGGLFMQADLKYMMLVMSK